MSEKDGGPAFPAQPTHFFEGAVSITAHNGMTLRDWFAGKAMEALITCNSIPDVAKNDHSGMSAAAYAYADAMLKDRAK